MFQELEKRGSKVLRSTSLSIKQIHTLSYIQNPLLLLLSSYVAGIILANIFGFLDYFSLFIIFIIVCLLSWLSYKNDWKITIILFLLSFLFIGTVNTSYHLQPVGPNNIYNFSGEQGNLFGTVCHTEIKQDYNYQEIQVNTNFFQLYDKRYQANGHVLLRVYGVKPVIKYGDVIKAEVLLQEPELPGNFGEFNYRDYLKRQNIFLTDSIEINKLEITGHSENLSINSLIYGIKNRITRKIEKIYKSPGKSLIKAILVGDKTEISRELTDIFQDAGIMHILAISGLHVGIIAIVLLFIFNLIPKYWINDLFKYLIIIIIMLGYAAMTGFRPSVSRATLMLAIVIIAKCFNRPYHIYNSLY
ncbi:MAG: ComEC/Rec2 family competence protein, partial [Atribacterota bacterium]